MNKHYLKSLAAYQCVNMLFYLLLSSFVGKPANLFDAGVCFLIGILVHKHFSYKNGN